MIETHATSPSDSPRAFTLEQKEYLQGFMAGVSASGQFPLTGGMASMSSAADVAAPASAEPIVHGTPLADLCKEERWKHAEDPLDAWERLLAHADADKFPDAENTYRFKTHGLFYV